MKFKVNHRIVVHEQQDEARATYGDAVLEGVRRRRSQ